MPAHLVALGHATVRICDERGGFHGLGYRLAADLVVTCAHVVTQALGGTIDAPSAPDGELRIDAPFLPPAAGDLDPVSARVLPGGWFPRRPFSTVEELADLAVLRLSRPLPGPSATLDPGLSLADREFAAYGGIDGYEHDPVPIDGRVGRPLANGRYKLTTAEGDFRIEGGCSGAPACDRRTAMVIGLIAQGERDPGIRAGFLIPAAHVQRALRQAGVGVAAVGTLATLRDHIGRHVAALDYTLAGACKRFIDYYAGTPEEPMPFAGRDAELAALDAWAAGTAGFHLLSGPAGRGKSALLLHWAARQLGDGEVALLLLPISIRFETSDELRGLRLLHAQLAALFSELRFPPDAKPDPSDYRGRIGEGWAAIAAHPERRFLLLIDGADEAASAWITQEVLPYEIPPNLAILLSARHKPGDVDGRAWLRDFSFAPGRPCAAPLELTPLTAAAVGDAIIQLGYPLDALVERAAVLAELYRLTDRGDPLLVNLWVRQLWSERQRAARYTAADLQRLQPSFAGFLQVWRKEQDKLWKAQGLTVDFDDLERLLRLLALAYAPLRIEDVLALLARLPPAARWDLAFVRTLLNGASRLVVRTGAGYAFVHPRLGDHYRAELPAHKEECEALPNAYLAWGAETARNLNAGTFAPAQCPAYLLRHYLDHVTAARLVPEQALAVHLLPLLGGGWHRAWLEEEGAYGGFLADLARVRQMLRQTNTARPGPPYRVAEELRISFIRTSIRAQTARLPPELIVALVQAGEWTGLRGLRVAEQLPDLQKRTQALISLLDLLPAHLCQQGLAEALTAVTAIGDKAAHAQALAAVAAHLTGQPRRQVLAEALTAATAIGDEGRRADALAAVAAHLAGEPALLAEALAAATAIGDEGRRARALAAVAAHLAGEPRRQVLARAIAAATAIGDEGRRTQALAAVAVHLAGEPALLAEALATATAIDDEGARARALAAVAARLAGEPALLAQALAAATAIGHEGLRANALAAVAVHLAGEPALLAEAFAAFIQALDLVAEQDRNALLDFTTCLLPVIKVVSGPAALGGTAEAIVDTAEWWR